MRNRRISAGQRRRADDRVGHVAGSGGDRARAVEDHRSGGRGVASDLAPPGDCGGHDPHGAVGHRRGHREAVPPRQLEAERHEERACVGARQGAAEQRHRTGLGWADEGGRRHGGGGRRVHLGRARGRGGDAVSCRRVGDGPGDEPAPAVRRRRALRRPGHRHRRGERLGIRCGSAHPMPATRPGHAPLRSAHPMPATRPVARAASPNDAVIRPMSASFAAPPRRSVTGGGGSSPPRPPRSERASVVRVAATHGDAEDRPRHRHHCEQQRCHLDHVRATVLVVPAGLRRADDPEGDRGEHRQRSRPEEEPQGRGVVRRAVVGREVVADHEVERDQAQEVGDGRRGQGHFRRQQPRARRRRGRRRAPFWRDVGRGSPSAPTDGAHVPSCPSPDGAASPASRRAGRGTGRCRCPCGHLRQALSERVPASRRDPGSPVPPGPARSPRPRCPGWRVT